jgi:hypothetical protein
MLWKCAYICIMGRITHGFDLRHFKPHAEMDQNPTQKYGFGTVAEPASPIAQELAPVSKEVHLASEGGIHTKGFDEYEKGINTLAQPFPAVSEEQEMNSYFS